MTEYGSQHTYLREDSGRHAPRSSSNLSTSRRPAESYSDSRIIAQTLHKIDSRNKHFTSTSKEVNRRNVSILGDKYDKHNMDEKLNGMISEDFKVVQKHVRPSDSSYARKVSWDANNSVEKSFFNHSSKSHQIKDSKQSKKKLDNFHADISKELKKNRAEDVSYFSQLSKIGQMNGITHNSHSNTLPIYKTVDQMVNGFGPSEVNQHLTVDSSHLQSLCSETSNFALHKGYPDLNKKALSAKYQSPTQSQNQRSPSLNLSFTNSLNEYSTSSSQRMSLSQECSSRPSSSLWGEEEMSNEEKSLAVTLSNPVTTVSSTPEKPRYPYSIDMKEGMFRTVKDGPEHETLKVHIIENFGSGDLKDGGFSWGWSIERRNAAQPSPKTVSKERNGGNANKDFHKSKRRLEYDKTSSSSPTPKRSKVKGGGLECQDTNGNKEKYSKNSIEIKNLPSNASASKYSSSHLKQNYGHGEKPVTKSSKSCDPSVEERKLSSVEKSLNPDKDCGFAVSSMEKRKSPLFVPSSEMMQHLPKNDCLGKNNNVIDDATMGFISSKKERSAVYSGKKSVLEVQPLKVMCCEAVKKNILGIKIGRNVPFELLMPALILCSPSKLHKIEEHNRHILRFTDSLWKKFCETEFRDERRLNGEPWKNVYWRARNLREKKLKNLAASISNGMSKAHPERQVKWVGTGSNNPEKRQKKIKEEVHKTEEIPTPKPESNGKSSASSHKEPPVKKRSGSESSSSNSPPTIQKPSSQSKSQVPKAAKRTLAPLMSKTKKMLNLVNRRR